MTGLRALIRAALAGTLLMALGACGSLAGYDPQENIVVQNYGSTNTRPWTITVHSDGSGSASKYIVKSNSHPTTIDVPAGTFDWRKFSTDLRTAGPALNGPRGCTKSTSFGSATTITYHGATTSDISCLRRSAPIDAVLDDGVVVESAFGLVGLSRATRAIPS